MRATSGISTLPVALVQPEGGCRARITERQKACNAITSDLFALRMGPARMFYRS